MWLNTVISSNTFCPWPDNEDASAKGALPVPSRWRVLLLTGLGDSY